MTDYNERAQTLDLASKEEIKAMVDSEDVVVFLDVRGESEIAEQSLEGPFNVVYAPCSRTDATELMNKSAEILPDKNGECRRYW